MPLRSHLGVSPIPSGFQSPKRPMPRRISPIRAGPNPQHLRRSKPCYSRSLRPFATLGDKKKPATAGKALGRSAQAFIWILVVQHSTHFPIYNFSSCMSTARRGQPRSVARHSSCVSVHACIPITRSTSASGQANGIGKMTRQIQQEPML